MGEALTANASPYRCRRHHGAPSSRLRLSLRGSPLASGGKTAGPEAGEAISTAISTPAVRHPVMAWAYLVAAQEAEFPRDAHRQNNSDRAGYLQHLVGLGYVLSDVEQLIVDNAAANGERSSSSADLEQPEEVTPDNIA